MNYSSLVQPLDTLMLVICKYRMRCTAPVIITWHTTYWTVGPFKMGNIYDFDHENVAQISYKIYFFFFSNKKKMNKQILNEQNAVVVNTKRLIYFPSRRMQCEKCLSEISSVVICKRESWHFLFNHMLSVSTQFVYLGTKGYLELHTRIKKIYIRRNITHTIIIIKSVERASPLN